MTLTKRGKAAQEKPVYPEPDRLPESHQEWFSRIACTARCLEGSAIVNDQKRIIADLDVLLYNPWWALGKLAPEVQPVDLTKLTLESFQGWVWTWLRSQGLLEPSIDLICADIADQDAEIRDWEKTGQRPKIGDVLGVRNVIDQAGRGKGR